MSILCNLGRHKAIPSKLWNDGRYFSRCQHCGIDLIRVPDGRWQAVPPHLKVVWRRRSDDDVVWPSHLL